MKAIENYKRIIPYLMLCIALTSCSNKLSRIDGVKFYSRLESFIPNGQPVELNDSLLIFKKRDLVLYKIPVEVDSLNVHKNTIDSFHATMIPVGITYRYLLFKEGDERGELYFNISRSKGKSVRVDSMLEKIAFKNFPFFDLSNDTIIYSRFDRLKKELVEKATPKIRKDLSYPDTTFLYYSNLVQGAPYTFSPELEKNRKLKIQRVLLQYTTPVYDRNGKPYPKREYEFILTPAQIDKATELAFFQSGLKN